MTRLAAPTPRELEILELVALGLGDKEIGVQLGISPRAVRAHLEKCRYRLGAESRSHAVALAISLGLLDIESHTPVGGVAPIVPPPPGDTERNP